MYNNHINPNCLQNVPVKKLRKLVNIIAEDNNKSKVPRFYWPTVYSGIILTARGSKPADDQLSQQHTNKKLKIRAAKVTIN